MFFNAIFLLECVPSSIKEANITPIYKGKGKNPLDLIAIEGSGYPMCSAKSLTLARMLPELETKVLTSVVCHVKMVPLPCMKPLYTHLARNGNTVFQTFYDLEKAFDSVEYYILLKHLYSSGIHGKCWRIMQSFYDRPKGHVKVNSCLSQGFLIERGVEVSQRMSNLKWVLQP